MADGSDWWKTEPRVAWVALLLDSFRARVGRELIDRSGSAVQQAERLFHAPFIVVSHGTEADPVLNYGNQAALALWEMGQEEFLRTPSRRTAEPANQRERADMLHQAVTQGLIRNYSGIRISRTGRRFRVKDAIVWNVRDSQDRYVGQAATFSRWAYVDEH